MGAPSIAVRGLVAPLSALAIATEGLLAGPVLGTSSSAAGASLRAASPAALLRAPWVAAQVDRLRLSAALGEQDRRASVPAARRTAVVGVGDRRVSASTPRRTAVVAVADRAAAADTEPDRGADVGRIQRACAIVAVDRTAMANLDHITKGDDYTATVTLYEDGALAAGLAGATATLRITDPAGTTTSKAGTVDADAGTVTASWTDTETTALAVGDHKFDVHVVKSGGVDLTYPKGGGYLTLRVVAPRSG